MGSYIKVIDAGQKMKKKKKKKKKRIGNKSSNRTDETNIIIDGNKFSSKVCKHSQNLDYHNEAIKHLISEFKVV